MGQCLNVDKCPCRGGVVPDYVYSLKAFKDYMYSMKDGPTKERILAKPPYSVNYSIKRPAGKCFRAMEPKEIIWGHQRSCTSLKTHIMMSNISDQCDVGVNQVTYDEIQRLHAITDEWYQQRGFTFTVNQICS
jgi:hypothetical protein